MNPTNTDSAGQPDGAPLTPSALLHWTEAGEARTARWQSEAGVAPPKHVVVADDTMSADVAYRLACEGTALLWRSDFNNARQMLQAMARRAERKPARVKKAKAAATSALKPALPLPAATFHLHRQAQSQRARTLGMLLLPFESDHTIPLTRAPDVRSACTEAWGAAQEPYVASLRELLGLIGAREWRKKGVEIPALGGERIHPHYGVFAPVRGEYVGLVAQAPLPSRDLAFDIGTGTGVLAAVLARRGVRRIVATDLDPRALVCARENVQRLGLGQQVEVVQADLFPPGKAPLIVCNPPWLPARPSSPIEHAIFDPDSRMLRAFLDGLCAHLEPGGEGWLILSDLAEHLGLRTRTELLAHFDRAGLKVINRIDIRPTHRRAIEPADASDTLYLARAAELTSLWRLGAR